MKFSLDLHGVIDALPEVFSFLSKAIVDAKGEVHVVTGSSWNLETEQKLKDLNITWTHHFSVYDYLIESGAPTVGEVIFPDGTIQKKFEDGHWDQVKGEYCLKHNICLHIDDTLCYNDGFNSAFCRLWTHNNKPKQSHKDLRHLD